MNLAQTAFISSFHSLIRKIFLLNGGNLHFFFNVIHFLKFEAKAQLYLYEAFSHDVTAAMLMFQKKRNGGHDGVPHLGIELNSVIQYGCWSRE